jgi:hypothetical protein
MSMSFCTEIMCATAGKKLLFYYVFVLNQPNNSQSPRTQTHPPGVVMVRVRCGGAVRYADLEVLVDADADVADVVAEAVAVVSIFQIPKV